MRSTLGIVLGVLFLWVVYILSPLAALVSIGSSMRAGDVAAIESRIDAKQLRTSLARQIAAAYMRATGAQKEPGSTTSQFGAAAAAAIVDPLIAPYLTPEALIRMITTGQVPALPGEKPAAQGVPAGVIDDLDLSRMISLRGARDLFFASEWRGFRSYLLALPLDKPMPERFRLEMGLAGLTWQITGLELPVPLRDRIVQQIIARGTSS